MSMSHIHINEVPVGGLFFIETYGDREIRPSSTVYKKLKPVDNIDDSLNRKTPIIRILPEIGDEVVFWDAPVFFLG